jgi:cytochrome P450
MKMPDGDRGLTTINMMRFTSNPLLYLENCHHHYGDPFTIYFNIFPPMIVVSEPKAIKQVFTSPQFVDTAKGNDYLRHVFSEKFVMFLEGESHTRRRRLVMPCFRGKHLESYGHYFCENAKKAIDRCKTGESLAIAPYVKEIFRRAFVQVLFGPEDTPCRQQIGTLVEPILQAFGAPVNLQALLIQSFQYDWGAWSPWGRFVRQRRQLDELLYAEIQQRRTQFDPSSTDILSLMVSGRDENGEPMTDTELHDELVGFLLAGNDTSSTSILWVLYWIHQSPIIRDKLVQELNSLGANPDPNAILELPYLTAVCQEALRISPVSLFSAPRIVKSPVELMGYQIDAGTWVTACIYLAHQREEIYPQPQLFKPERFLDRSFSAYEYLPFGGGSRRCIGMALALVGIKLIVATVLLRVRLELDHQRPVKPVFSGTTVVPSGGLRMIVKERMV